MANTEKIYGSGGLLPPGFLLSVRYCDDIMMTLKFYWCNLKILMSECPLDCKVINLKCYSERCIEAVAGTV